MLPNKIKAKNEAQLLIKNFNNTDSPINLFALLKYIDIECRPFDPKELNLQDISSEDVSAFIEYNENLIMYNQNHPKTRLRFSIAHEIGHYQLNHKSVPHSNNYDSKDPFEIEANSFAAELLMPVKKLELESIENDSDIKVLAKKYQVSFEAMQWQICTNNKLLKIPFDYLTKYSNRQKSLADEENNSFDPKDVNDYSNLYPLSKDFEDSYEDALEFYGNLSSEDLENLSNWIKEFEIEDDYPESYRAIQSLLLELN